MPFLFIFAVADELHILGRMDIPPFCFFYKPIDVVTGGIHHSTDRIPTFHNRKIQPRVSIQRNVTPLKGQNLDNDVIWSLNKAADCRQFLLIHIELGWLNLIQRSGQELYSGIFLYLFP